MSAFGPLLKKEMLEVIRSKKLLILGIIFTFTAIASPVLAKLIPSLLKSMPATPGLVINMPEPTWHDAIDQFVKNLNQIVGIVIVFMFAGVIAEEKNKKTLELVLTKPVARSKFVLAKFFSSVCYLWLSFIGCAIVFYIYTMILFAKFSLVNFAWLGLFLLVYLTLVVSLTIFASTLVSNQIVAAAIAFFGEIIIFTVLGIWKRIENYLPGYSLGHYKELMTGGKIADFLPSIWISLALIIILIMGAIYIFNKQEVER